MSTKKLKSTKKSKEYISDFLGSKPKNLKEKLTDYFSGINIYCEIFNGSDNISESFYSKIKEYNPHIYKSLSKNIDYIVFKDGKLKTKRFATLIY